MHIDKEECAMCHGYCEYNRIYDVDGLPKEWNFTCVHTGGFKNSHAFVAIFIAIYVGNFRFRTLQESFIFLKNFIKLVHAN